MKKQVYPQSHAFPKRLVIFGFVFIFFNVPGSKWSELERGLGIGSNQGLEHDEIVASDLQSSTESWELSKRAGREDFYSSLIYFYKQSKQFKNKPTTSVHV